MKGEKIPPMLRFSILIYYFRNMAPEIVYRRQDIYICTHTSHICQLFFSLINLVMVMRAVVELLAEDKPSNGNDDGGRVANC